MKGLRTGFTLVEMMIAVVLIAMMSLFMYNAGDQLQTTNRFFMDKDRAAEKEARFYRLLYLDLMESLGQVDVNGTEDFDILSFQTENTIHDIARPYVIYAVTKKNENALIRIESNAPIPSLPFKDEDLYTVKVDTVATRVERFKLFKGKKQEKLLIYMKEQEQEPFMVELVRVNR